MDKRIIIILSARNFCDEEYHKSRLVFESFGIKCSVAASELSGCTGMEGTCVKPDLLVKDINVYKCNALCFIGGVGSTAYWHDKAVHNIAISANKAGLLLGAICLAPVILANAGLLRGVHATAYPSAANSIRRRGARYSKKSVEIDNNIITANGPEAAFVFAQNISKLLLQETVQPFITQ